MTARIVLASASPARAMLLRAAGVDFTAYPSSVDEDALTTALGTRASVTELVDVLAQAKARAVADVVIAGTLPVMTHAPSSLPPAVMASATLVIGCDSMLEFQGRAYGKPGNAETAIARWQLMRGKSGVLHTGHHVIRISSAETAAGGQQTVEYAAAEVVSTQVDFADVSDGEIAAYVATGEPLQVAGAFTLDSRGSAFITGVVGDHANVVGLSIAALRRLTGVVGIEWTELWTPRPAAR